MLLVSQPEATKPGFFPGWLAVAFHFKHEGGQSVSALVRLDETNSVAET